MVAILAEEGYVDKRLLLYEFGNDLYQLERYLTNFEHRNETQIPSIHATFPNAYNILKEAAKYYRKESGEAFSRLNNYQRSSLIRVKAPAGGCSDCGFRPEIRSICSENPLTAVH